MVTACVWYTVGRACLKYNQEAVADMLFIVTVLERNYCSVICHNDATLLSYKVFMINQGKYKCSVIN